MALSETQAGTKNCRFVQRGTYRKGPTAHKIRNVCEE
jgi:hypothetical protein